MKPYYPSHSPLKLLIAGFWIQYNWKLVQVKGERMDHWTNMTNSKHETIKTVRSSRGPFTLSLYNNNCSLSRKKNTMQLHFANNFLWKYFYELLLTVNKFFVCRDHITLWAEAVGRRGRTWNSNFSNNGLNFRYASNLFIWLSTFCQQLSKYSDL